ncbi:MAG: hypothetical protein IJ589_05730 [Lachnospiraceae bacterium]|nr:hypothetical protein [Lachnospiraceae bacterium]
MAEIDLANVEIVGKRAVGFGRYKILHVPASCRVFAGGNLVKNGYLKDVYFHSPDTEIDDLICQSGDGEKIRIHGFPGTAVELECETDPYHPPIVFVPDMK